MGAACGGVAIRTAPGPLIAPARPGGGAHGCGGSLPDSGLEPVDPLSAPADPFVETGTGDCLLSGRDEATPPFSSTIGAAANELMVSTGDAARRCPRTAELTRRGTPRPTPRPSPPRIDREVRYSSTGGSVAAVLARHVITAAAGAATGAATGAAAGLAHSELDAALRSDVGGAAAGTVAGAAAGAEAGAAYSEVDAAARPDVGAATGAGAAARLAGSLTCTGYAGFSGGGSGSSWLLLTAKTRGDGANPALLVSARGADASTREVRPRPGECPPRSEGIAWCVRPQSLLRRSHPGQLANPVAVIPLLHSSRNFTLVLGVKTWSAYSYTQNLWSGDKDSTSANHAKLAA